ncbi:MAG: phosphotransferase family protein [Rhizobiaceae bacterium]|nr:phosphotransferase family protein [Rhizobiaceae bacterium]
MQDVANSNFNVQELARFLAPRLENCSGNLQLERIGGGYSNPTFFMQFDNGGDYVLRKQPTGPILPSAHAIDREFRVISALAQSDVPVPEAFLYCDDKSIIGTPFYIMERLEGRVFHNNALPGLTPAERSAIFDSMNETLVALHKVDYEKVGLGDYGRPDGFLQRQVSRWTRQFEKSQTRPVREIDELSIWLSENVPDDNDETSIVHGDFRLGNLMIHPEELHVVAVLDWELSTLGHPLSDLGYNLMAWIMDKSEHDGLGGLDLDALGIPSMQVYADLYFKRRGLEGRLEPFYIALAFFRLAVIFEGIVFRTKKAGKSTAEIAAVERYGPIFSRHGLKIAGE